MSGITSASPPRRIIIAVAVVLAIAGLSYFIYRTYFLKTDENIIEVSGRLEGYETNLSPKIAGRVDWIVGREGDKVAAKQIVARLSDADYQAQLRGAEARILRSQHDLQQKRDQLSVIAAQVYGARQRLAQSREESRAQIEQARASLAEAEAREKQAQWEYEQAQAQLGLSDIRLARYTNLIKKGATTKDEFDQARTTRQNDASAVEARRAAVNAAHKTTLAARATLKQQEASRYTPPIRRSDIDVFEAQKSQAEHDVQSAQQDVANAIAERDQIKANLAYLQIFSPINGVITARPVEPGAVVTPGQTVLTVLDYGTVYMRAFVPEGRIGKVRIGQPAQVFLDAMPNKPFAGRVIEIDPEGSFTPENIYFKDDRVKQVFGIKVGLDNPAGFAKPGMPADARLELR